MRDLFRSFLPLSDPDKEEAWSEGLVIFDTSALLNLYRYPLSARDRLMTVLERLKDRVWLPHQVALEYQRNHPAVRLEQATKFRKVREEVGDLKIEFQNRIEKLQLRRRHALIDAEPLLAKVAGAIDEFQSELNQIERAQDDLYQGGSLQQKIEDIFEKRVGQPPTQEFLDIVYKEGAKRYEYSIPPGYLDSRKGDSSKESAAFSFGGLIFQRRFGDLILWKEIMLKIREDKMKWFIFVTDDAKEDWWRVTGGQKIGPRPELLDEAVREGGVAGFVLVTSERFTEEVASMLGMEVSAEVIQQISTARESAVLPSAIEEPAGILEKIGSAEDGLEELTQASEGLTLELNRIRGIMDDSTGRLKTAVDARMKVRVTNETASQIESAAIRFDEKIDAFELSIKKIEPGVEAIIHRIEQLKAEGSAVPGIQENLRSLLLAIVGTVESAEIFDGALANIPDVTAALRGAIRRLRAGVQHYIRSASPLKRWLDRLA